MESYFFVPGTRLNKIQYIKTLNVSEIIIDLEDAVKGSERRNILDKLLSSNDFREYFIRIPLYNFKEGLDTSFFITLYQNGFRRFVFPKLQQSVDFRRIVSEGISDELEIILLIETPRFFLEVQSILLEFRNVLSGIGIGSHDFMAEIGGIHELKNLEYIRQQVLYLARMSEVNAIDIASMELVNSKALEEEILDGFRKGYDAKFFIHPWQIGVFNTISLYSDQEIGWALNVQKEFKKVGSDEEFNPIVIDGQVIERPHLIKAKKIIKYYESK